MTTRTEGHFSGYNNADLFYQTWSIPSPRGTLVVTHGMAEHSESYLRFAEAMNGRSWNVIAWDSRGHGKSDGKRGYVEDFAWFSEDLKLFIDHLKKGKTLKKPFCLVAHSMGGLVLLKTLLNYGAMGASAVSLSSPLLGIAVKVPPAKDFAAKLLRKVLPTFTMANELHYEHLSHDQEVVGSYSKDIMRHDKISPALYFGMLETIAEIRAQHLHMTIPLLMQLAGDDKIVSRDASEAFFEKIDAEEKKKIVYEDFYHEIFNESERERVYDDLHSFFVQATNVTGAAKTTQQK